MTVFIRSLAFLFLASLTAIPAIAIAQTASPVVVTASRTAETADEALASITVITRDDIERVQAQSVMEVLRGLSGMSITNNGGPGKATSIHLRGTEADHVLVLMDGVKLGSATLGSVAFQDIPIDQIERIEVVRGPRSSLYGSEAIGGVIQIFTKKGKGPTQYNIAAGYGSRNTRTTSFNASGGGERHWFSIGASHMSTDSFDSCDGNTGAGCYANQPDEDGYENLAGSIKAGYRFRNGVEIEAHGLRAEGDNEFDGSSTNESETIQQALGGKLRFSPMKPWRVTLQAGQALDKSANYLNGTYKSTFDTARKTASIQNDIAIGANHTLTIGADYQNDTIDSTTNYDETSRDNGGLFAQYQGQYDKHDVQFSLRGDDNQQFGKVATGSLGWGYAINKTLRINASYGTAFSAPSFNNLYYPSYGVATLNPERSRSLEIGLKGKSSLGNWGLHAFQTDIDQMIVYDSDVSGPNNIDAARIRGLEATLAGRHFGWDLNLALTFLDPKNRSTGSNRGNILVRRARHVLRLDGDRSINKWRIGGTLLAMGNRYDNLTNTRQMSGFVTFDLRGEYEMTKNWRLQGRIENLTDAEYETASHYLQAGRGFFLTLRYKFGG